MKSYTIKLKLSQKEIQELHDNKNYSDVFGSVYPKLLKATENQILDYKNILNDQQRCNILTATFYRDSRSDINPDYTHLTDELFILDKEFREANKALWGPFTEKENRELKALLTENKIPEGYWPSQIRPISPEYAKAEKENETGE